MIPRIEFAEMIGNIIRIIESAGISRILDNGHIQNEKVVKICQS